MNIELRSKVLEYALSIESAINDLMMIYLRIDKQTTKALGNRSGTLSFKNKIDLLYDIGVFTKDEWLDLDLMMIYRNQFMHNIACTSFSSQFFEKSVTKRLIKFSSSSDESEEERLIEGYRHLHLHCLKLIKEKITNKRLSIESNSKALRFIVEESIGWYDIFLELMDDLEEFYDPQPSDAKEILTFKMELISKLGEIGKKIKADDTYVKLKCHFDQLKVTDVLSQTEGIHKF